MKKMHQIFLRLVKERGAAYNQIKHYLGFSHNAFKKETSYRNIVYSCLINSSVKPTIKKEWERLYTTMFISNVDEKELINFFKSHKKYGNYVNNCQKEYGKELKIKDFIIKSINEKNFPPYLAPIHEPYHLFKDVIKFGNTITRFEKDWHVFVSDHLKELAEDI